MTLCHKLSLGTGGEYRHEEGKLSDLLSPRGVEIRKMGGGSWLLGDYDEFPTRWMGL